MTDRGQQRPSRNADHVNFGEVFDVEQLTDAQRAELQDEDPLRFIATDLDHLARVRGLESIPLVELYRIAETAHAEYKGLDPREEVLDALDAREQALRADADAKRAIAEVEQAQTGAQVREILMAEVERDEPREEVVAACNRRQDALREAAAADGGDGA